MKGMSNNQIILSEAEKLAPATLHTIATAHHTAAQIEALAAQITVTEDDGTQHPGTTHDAEIMLAASELHTFDYWKKEGKSVKLHEKALIECYLWKYTTKPSKAQREAAEAEGKEAAPDPHYYPTKSHLFSCLQVQDSKPAPAGRFSSTAEIIAYNKKLAAERKAAAKAAAEQADTKNALDVLKQTECKAKAAFLAVPETDRKAQAEALSAWRKARQDIAAAEKPAEPTTKPAPEIIPAGVTDKKPGGWKKCSFYAICTTPQNPTNHAEKRDGYTDGVFNYYALRLGKATIWYAVHPAYGVSIGPGKNSRNAAKTAAFELLESVAKMEKTPSERLKNCAAMVAAAQNA